MTHSIYVQCTFNIRCDSMNDCLHYFSECDFRYSTETTTVPNSGFQVAITTRCTYPIKSQLVTWLLNCRLAMPISNRTPASGTSWVSWYPTPVETNNRRTCSASTQIRDSWPSTEDWRWLISECSGWTWRPLIKACHRGLCVVSRRSFRT